MLNVPITPPRVPLIDPRSGNVSREWYMFFLSLNTAVSGSDVSLDDLQKTPPTVTIDEVNGLLEAMAEDADSQQGAVLSQVSEIQKQIDGIEISPTINGLLDQIDVLQKRVDALEMKPEWGYLLSAYNTLASLSDVNIATPSDGDKLIYDSSTKKWKNVTISYLVLE